MALDFVSGDPRIVIGRVPEVESATAMTFAVWLRSDQTSADAAIVVRGAAFDSNAAWVLYRDEVAYVSGRTNTLAAQVRTDVGLLRIESASDAMNDNNWHHVALVFEAGAANGLRMYIDGAVDPYSTSTVGHANVSSSTNYVHLGFASGSIAFDGAMADVAIWDTALGEAAIAQLAAGFSPLTLTGALQHLAVYYDLVRTINRPGIGPVATTGGVLAAAPHPAIRFPTSEVRLTSSAPSLISGPHRRQTGAAIGGASEAGTALVPGIAAGTLTPIGEVLG